MTADLYVWKAPRDLDPEQAAALVGSWRDEGGDPTAAPFEPSSDVCWFYRELSRELPGISLSSDATGDDGRLPIWLSDKPAPPARVVAIELLPANARDAVDSIFGLATKYDLIVFDPRQPRPYQPMAEMAAYSSATFWPRGAIRAFVVGGVGLGLAVVAWLAGIPIVSPVLVLVGGFLFVMAVLTFIYEGRRRLGRRRGGSRAAD